MNQQTPMAEEPTRSEVVMINHKPNHVALGGEVNHNTGMVATQASREMQEVRGMIVMAKQFPRDEKEAYDKIMNACERQSLAEVALYSYAKGGTAITGPSIRLAEAMAQYWGNLDYGVREVERRGNVSVMQAYCWDMETNVRRVQVFDVPHTRDTKQGKKPLNDEREIYENNANNGARRLRACILAVIPGDIVEAAWTKCESTLKIKVAVTPERVKKMEETLAEYGVNRAMIEARIQRSIGAIEAAQFFNLGKVCNSLKDGMSTIADWFDLALADKAESPKADENKLDKFKDAAKPKDNPKAPAAPATDAEKIPQGDLIDGVGL